MVSSRGLIEGDFLETDDGLFFSVKGFRHPENYIIAYLRYMPNSNGSRMINGKRYQRVYDLDSTTDYLKANYPIYINRVDYLGQSLQTVPIKKIIKVYKPRDGLKNIFTVHKTSLEKRSVDFVCLLSEKSGIPLKYFGVSGSLLIGSSTEESDIDIIIYGKFQGRVVYETLKRIRNKNPDVQQFTLDQIKPIVISRWGDLKNQIDKLSSIEIAKMLHGMYQDTPYFIRLLNKQINKSEKSIPLGPITFRGIIMSDEESIYTPCIYNVKCNIPIGNSVCKGINILLSYRGKFTEQLKKNEEFEVKGTLEKVYNKGGYSFRVILGKQGDYLLPL